MIVMTSTATSSTLRRAELPVAATDPGVRDRVGEATKDAARQLVIVGVDHNRVPVLLGQHEPATGPKDPVSLGGAVGGVSDMLIDALGSVTRDLAVRERQ